jgi:hypothetical protein
MLLLIRRFPRATCTFVVKLFTMQIPHLINLFHSEMSAWRQDLHVHPELGFEEHRTSEFVAGKLAESGCEAHRKIGETGVVGVLRTGYGPSIGLLADMDALPIHEADDFPYRSKHDGRMHACGHDDDHAIGRSALPRGDSQFRWAIVVTLSTPLSAGLILRETIACSAVVTWQAVSTGSIPCSGRERVSLCL